MKPLTILNTRDVKKIREQVVQQFGFFVEEDYAFLQNENQRIFIVNKDISKIDLKKLIVDRMGLYFAEIKPNQVRLSKEGAQFLVQRAREAGEIVSNVIDLNEEEVRDYFAGHDLPRELGESRLIILTYKNEVLGCAKYKEGKILNYLPKIHRGEVIV